MLVLNERDFSERVIANCDLGKRPMDSLYRVMKYYAALGDDRATVTKKAQDLFKLAKPMAYDRYKESIAKLAKKAMKDRLLEIDSLNVTKGELSKIADLPTLPHKKLAFALLCIAKFHMVVNPESNGWVRESDTEIFALANIENLSHKKHGLMLNDIMQAGLIEFSNLVNSTSIRVLFMDYTEPELEVSDMRMLGYQYCRYIGKGKYVPCAACGQLVPVKNKHNLVVYCAEHREPDARGKRVAVCPDCGDMRITSAMTKTDRCPRCYEIYRQNAFRDSAKKQKSVG